MRYKNRLEEQQKFETKSEPFDQFPIISLLQAKISVSADCGMLVTRKNCPCNHFESDGLRFEPIQKDSQLASERHFFLFRSELASQFVIQKYFSI